MDNEKQYLQALKHMYKKNRVPLSTHQLNAYKSVCKNNKQYLSWRKVQWLLACTGLAFLCIQLFVTSPVHEQSTSDLQTRVIFQNVEIHRMAHGQYQREIVTKKQSLDTQLANSRAIQKAAIFHGEVIEQNINGWLIADCQRNTLITLEQSLLEQLVPNWKSQPPYTGRHLELNQNSVGHITRLQIKSLGDVKNGQQIYSCP
jgi:hypothetical protein